MESQYLSELVNWIKGASPYLLEVAKQKVYADVFTNIIWMLLAIALICVAKKTFDSGNLEFKKHDEFDMHDFNGGIVMVISAAVIVVGVLVFASGLNYVVGVLLARDWYVINALVTLGKSVVK